jgi:hypothetical protein
MCGASRGLGGGSGRPNRLESEGVQADQEAFHGTRGSRRRVLGLVCPPEIVKKILQERWRRRRRRCRRTGSREAECVQEQPSREGGGGGGGASREVGREGEADRWEGGG